MKLSNFLIFLTAHKPYSIRLLSAMMLMINFLSPTFVTEIDVYSLPEHLRWWKLYSHCTHTIFIHDKCSVIVNWLNLWLSIISLFNYLRFTTFFILQVQCNMSPSCGDNLRRITIIMVRDLITNIQTLFGPVDRGWITLLTPIQVLRVSCGHPIHKSPRKKPQKGGQEASKSLNKYIFIYYIILF